MRISTAYLFRQGVNNLLDNQAALSKTQLQLATGRSLLAPSDDPSAAVRTLQLKDRLAQVQQYQRNGDAAEARLTREEQVLAGMTDTLQRVRELTVQGLNDSNGPEDRHALAAEVRQHLESLLAAANETDANGEYLFAGNRTDTKPFAYDAVSGSYVYGGDSGQRLVQLSDTRYVASNDPGDGLFMGLDDGSGGSTNLFDMVKKVADDLEADSPDGISLTQLDNAMERIDQGRAAIGGRRNAIDQQREMHASFGLVLEQQRSRLEDLDYAEAASRMQRQLLALQATQQTFTKVQGLSLFNYL
jgi:flagellar hook-associated protein 3 FlgL